MPDNLTVKIIADASQVNTEIDLLKAKLRDLGKQIKQASQTALASGDKTVVRQLEIDAETTRVQIKRLDDQLKQLHRTAGDTSGSEKLARNFEDFAKTLSPIAGNLIDIRKGLIGLVAAEALRQFGEQIDETAKKILALKRVSAGTGVDIPTIQAAQELFKEVGAEADDVGKIFLRVQKGADDLSIKLRNAGVLSGAGLNVLRGSAGDASSGFNVLRGGAQDFINSTTEVVHGSRLAKVEITDFDSGLRTLGIDFQKFLKESPTDRIIEIANALRKMTEAGKPDVAQLASIQLFGKTWRESAEAILRLADELIKKKEEMAAAGQFITPDDVKRAQEYQTALVGLNASYEKLKTALGVALFPAIRNLFREATKTLEADIKDVEKIINLVNRLLGLLDEVIARARRARDAITHPEAARAPLPPPAARGAGPGGEARPGGEAVPPRHLETDAEYFARTGFHYGPRTGEIPTAVRPERTPLPISKEALDSNRQLAVDQIAKDWAAAEKNSTEFFAGLNGGLDKANVKVQELSRQIDDIKIPSPAPSPEGKAAGGYIRGPGTGTSDSILARLSNGEFVTRASAVRHYGTGFFEALNSQRYGVGGLVDAIHARPGPHFAEGGLVSAAASTPVHLHIGGGTYPTSASSGVAAALVGAAKHSQIVSSGIKPSWYGR